MLAVSPIDDSPERNAATIRRRVLELFGQNSGLVIAEGEDIFAKLNLSSLEILKTIVRLEQTFAIVIGESPSEFDRIRTFAGLVGLVAEKAAVEASEPQ